jgi:hypothetical protein
MPTREELEYRQALLRADRTAVTDNATRVRTVARGTVGNRRLRAAGDELQKYMIGGLQGSSTPQGSQPMPAPRMPTTPRQSASAPRRTTTTKPKSSAPKPRKPTTGAVLGGKAGPIGPKPKPKVTTPLTGGQRYQQRKKKPATSPGPRRV